MKLKSKKTGATHTVTQEMGKKIMANPEKAHHYKVVMPEKTFVPPETKTVKKTEPVVETTNETQTDNSKKPKNK